MIELTATGEFFRLFGEPVANRTVRDAILARLRRHGGSSSLSVSNLVFPRQAYYGAKFPDVEIPLERRESMIAGTAFHKEFLDRVGREATVEQYLEWEGVRGRVDLYEELPLEVKRTDAPVTADDIKRLRPSYLEQLGIYCGMAGKDRGYLLVYNASGKGPLFTGAAVHYGLLSGIRREIKRRRDAFRNALESNDPSGLPACPFAGTTCVWSEQGICNCSPDEPRIYPVADLAVVAADAALGEEFGRRYQTSRRVSEPAELLLTPNDLARPRYAVLNRLTEGDGEDEDVVEEMRSDDNYAFYREFRAQCFRGSDHRVERRELSGVRSWVAFNDGRVTLFTKCGFAQPVKRHLLARTFRDPFLRLAFNCVLAGQGRARLVVWYPEIPMEDERVLVYDLTVQDLQPFRDEMMARVEAIRQAIESGDVSGLPKCEAWRAKWCEHSPACGCGVAEANASAST